MMMLVFMSVLSILFIILLFSCISGEKVLFIEMQTTVALCRDQCLILLSATQPQITISAQKDLHPERIPLKGLLGFAFLKENISR